MRTALGRPAVIRAAFSPFGRETAQMAILGALFLAILVVFLAVGLQFGFAFTERRHLQNTADAAALAGAQELDGSAAGKTAAIAAAQAYADQNASGLDTFTPTVNDEGTEIRVTVANKVPGVLASKFGLGDPTISATAKARVATVNSLSPCVEPLGIQQSIYQEAYEAWLNGEEHTVALSVAIQSTESGSNTGLLNITSGNLAEDFRYGACDVLTPLVDTKPGGSIGDMNNGIQDRLEAAMDAGCYDYDDVTNPANYETCIPPLFDFSDDEIRATAVFRVPILATDIITSGSTDMPVAPASEPDGWYLLADFWIDGDATYDTTAANWKCIAQPDCIIYGRFLFNVPAPLNVWDPDLCPPEPEECLLEFDPQALIKVVQLIE